MPIKKLPEDFQYLPDMYADGYFPDFLVDKVRDTIKEAVQFIEEGDHSKEDIQGAFDQMTITINELQNEFEENDSELETVARDSIAMTVIKVLEFFEIDIDVEEALRDRDR